MMNITALNLWVAAIGWTLLHSFWQALIIYFAFLVSKVFVRTSTGRYHLGAASLGVIVLFALFTLDYEYKENTPSLSASTVNASYVHDHSVNDIHAASGTYDIITLTGSWINEHLHIVVLVWLAGATFFSFRLLAAWAGTVRLRAQATPVNGFWQEKLFALAADLNLVTRVVLMECRAVNIPVVLGYFRPVILLPVGMLSGHSAEMVEAILLHELAHIKRHDYLINILQSLLEVVLFFNPFVWMISANLRDEREQCCDDIVIRFKSPLTYAKALHKLEEDKTLHVTMALAATGRKNQLLQRIKRIMETPEKKDAGNRKILPVMILVIALLSASWFSVEAYLPGDIETDSLLVKKDTTKKDLMKLKSTNRSNKTVTTVGPDGIAHTVTTDVQDTGADIDDIEEIQEMEIIPPMPAPDLSSLGTLEVLEVPLPGSLTELSEIEFPADAFNLMDTFPGNNFMQKQKEWEAFSKTFTEKFSHKFSDFYSKNGPELDQLMKEMELKMEKMSDVYEVRADLNEQMRNEMMEARRMAEDAFHTSRDQYNADRDLARMNAKLASHRQMEALNERLQSLLIRDGYLGKDEKLTRIEWRPNGESEFNGKKLKAKDQQKYRELEEEYNQRSKVFETDEQQPGIHVE